MISNYHIVTHTHTHTISHILDPNFKKRKKRGDSEEALDGNTPFLAQRMQ